MYVRASVKSFNEHLEAGILNVISYYSNVYLISRFHNEIKRAATVGETLLLHYDEEDEG